MTDFFKYAGICIGVQLLACVGLWVLAVVFSSDSLFGIMIYAYWPVILGLAAVLGGKGESAMIALPLFGSVLGMLIYGTIGGLIISGLRAKRA